MLAPKRVKFRKMFKGRTNGIATRGAEVSFGHFGLQALEPGCAERHVRSGQERPGDVDRNGRAAAAQRAPERLRG